MRSKFWKSLAIHLLALFISLSPAAFAAKPAAIEIQGELAIRFNNCGCPEHQAVGPDISYLLKDPETLKMTELAIDEQEAKNLDINKKVGKTVKLRGRFQNEKASIHHTRKGKAFKPSRITQVKGEVAEEGTESTDPATGEGATASSAPLTANAAVTTELVTLIIHANTADRTAEAGKITSMQNMVFDGADNASDAVFAATYGHYRLVPGPVKSITVDLPGTTATATSAGTMEDQMVDALPAAFAALSLSYNKSDYDRFLVCVPNGTTGIGTAYAGYSSTGPLNSVYSYGWTGTTLDGIVHELGHNFAFRHSGVGTNEYGDKTCVMGYSHLNRGAVTATYGAPKKRQAGWFSPFPETTADITEDATFDIYPISQAPDDDSNTPDMRIVGINGTDYYISYRSQFDPYAWLRDGSSDRHKVLVHTDNGTFFNDTWRVAKLASSATYAAGSTNVIFERLGQDNAYATVSFDLDDGNTKPVADAQDVITFMNNAISFTLTGSDSDTGPPDTLSFEVVTDPANGSLDGTAPNLTYTPYSGYIGSDSFVFKVNDGLISSFATVSITVNETNQAPVANSQSVNGFFETPQPITLVATDANGNPLTYTIVSDPTKGSLSGTPPNLIYTPDNGFSGSDSFTFKANDGFVDSNTATVTITVSSSTNTPPTVQAGPDQTVFMQEVTNTPGLYYGTVSGNINTTDDPVSTQILVDPSVETENPIDGNTTEVYTGNIYDADGQISFTEYIDDKTRIWIDGVLVVESDDYGDRVSSPNLNLSPGWHGIEIRISNGGGGSGPRATPGIGYDPAGGANFVTLSDPGDGSFLRVNAIGSEAEATLNESSVTDPEHSPTYVWTDTGTGTGTGTVTFSDANALSPSVTFTAVGTYVLRLTADDGYGPVFDEVTIIVNPPASNTPPVTDAGVDQTLYYSDAGGPSFMILAPTNAIEGFQSIDASGNITSVGWWSPNEPAHAIDGNVLTKYAGAGKVGSGFYITPGVGSTVLTGVKIYTANDVKGRDPLTITIEGSNGGDLTQGSSWTLIQDNVNLGINSDPGRDSAGPLVALSASEAYTHYRIIVKTLRDAGADGSQYAEMELYGTTGGAETTLDGSVTDGEQTPTISWSQIGGPGSASLSDANVLNPTVTFTEVGTYEFELTGDDGFVQTTDTVVITVNPPLSGKYMTWAQSFGASLTDIVPNANPDGDTMSNMLEFAFGTNPTLNDEGIVASDGSAHGKPMMQEGASAGEYDFFFLRRKDHGSSGSAHYQVQFSSDLASFSNYTGSVTTTDSTIDGANYEVVKVPFPAGSKFGRVEISYAP